MKKLALLLIVIFLLSAVLGCSTEERIFGAVQQIDEDDIVFGWEREGNRPYVLAPPFDLLIPNGDIAGHSAINKYGRNGEVDNGVTADVWDGGSTGNVSLIWVAPTQARVHDLASTSASDNATGSGARTLDVFGLTSWNSAETSETLSMSGTSNVATANSYVIVHRLLVMTKGATSANVGTITATARTDNTVTAQIQPNAGQTQMAILGVPSTQTIYMTTFYLSLLRRNATGGLDMELLVNQEPDAQLTTFVVKHTIGLFGSGSSHAQHFYSPYKTFEGPAIIKIQTTSSANDNDVSAGFDAILMNK